MGCMRESKCHIVDRLCSIQHLQRWAHTRFTRHITEAGIYTSKPQSPVSVAKWDRISVLKVKNRAVTFYVTNDGMFHLLP